MSAEETHAATLHSALAGVSAETVEAIVQEFEGAFKDRALGRPDFGAWLTMSPLERFTLTAQQLLAFEGLRKIYETYATDLPQAQQTVLGWFWSSYTAALRRADVVGKENQSLRKLAGADRQGPIPAPRRLRSIQLWAWADVPYRLEMAAPPGEAPAWAVLYPSDIDPALIAAVRRGLQSIPHAVCVRAMDRRRVEFLW